MPQVPADCGDGVVLCSLGGVFGCYCTAESVSSWNRPSHPNPCRNSLWENRISCSRRQVQHSVLLHPSHGKPTHRNFTPAPQPAQHYCSFLPNPEQISLSSKVDKGVRPKTSTPSSQGWIPVPWKRGKFPYQAFLSLTSEFFSLFITLGD